MAFAGEEIAATQLLDDNVLLKLVISISAAIAVSGRSISVSSPISSESDPG